MEDEFDFSEFDDDLDSEKKEKKEEITPKATNGEVTEIKADRRKDGVPHLDVHEIDDEIEPSDFDLTQRVAEFLDKHKTKLLKCCIIEGKIVTGREDYAASAFIRVTTDYAKDTQGEWIRTSSAVFKEQVDSLIAKNAFPINVRLAEKRTQTTGKPYYVLNG